jgi:hypothetical protein
MSVACADSDDGRSQREDVFTPLRAIYAAAGEVYGNDWRGNARLRAAIRLFQAGWKPGEGPEVAKVKVDAWVSRQRSIAVCVFCEQGCATEREVAVDYTTSIDEARELGEVDEDPPCGDFNDAASLALVRLAGECGCEDAGEMSTLDLYRFISESVFRPAKRVEVLFDSEVVVKSRGPVGIKVGDRVRIDKPGPRSRWVGWVEEMDETVGQTGVVLDVNCDDEYMVDINNSDDGWWYVAECLVVVAP